VVIYRRLMLRIAERIARHAARRSTGDRRRRRQVASQTLENLAVVGAVANAAIFRRSSAWTRTRS
jgi:thiamine biosynthesis protein ThiI